MKRDWPAEGATRVPYWVYQDEEGYAEEQVRIFRGPTWSYLCLEAELRVQSIHGIVFGTLSQDVPALETYIGPEILPRIKRVMIKPLKVLGRYTQVLPNNWKLYMDNTKDTYHASLLHLFFTRFRINRLTQKGGVFVSADGAHHCTYTEIVEDRGDAYEASGMRSAGSHTFKLEAPELLDQVDELGD